MKFALFCISLLLLTGCNHRDTRLREQIVGTWTNDNNFVMTFAADGGLVSRWAMPAKELTYQGMWTVQDGVLVSTLTNCIAQGTTNFEAVGSVDHFKIVQADHNDLVFAGEGQTISLKRKR
jgi:hypothetical protein